MRIEDVKPELPALKPFLLSVRATARILDRSESAIRHLYERGTLTPIRIDGRVFIETSEIEVKIAKARAEAV